MNCKKIFIIFPFAFVILLLLFSCKANKNKEDIKQIVHEWTGKEIKFPNNMPCYVSGKETSSEYCSRNFRKEFKILSYVDSAECSGCRLKLTGWQRLMQEADSLFPEKIGFLFYFQPKTVKEMKYIFLKDHFDYPVYIDINNAINQINHFPQNFNYQCFLLNQENKVVAIGNPVLNPKIWELYKQTISGKAATNTQQQPITTVSVQQQEITLSGLQKDKTTTTVFKLKNTGGEPLLITHIDSSCGCTVPKYDKKPAEPGADAEIKVEVTPNETGVFHKTIRVYCNTEKGIVTLAVKGMVEQ